MSSLPERGLPGDARLYIPKEGTRARPPEPLTVENLQVRHDRTHFAVLCSAIALVLATAAGLAFWLLRPNPLNSSAPTIDTSSSADPEAQARLVRLLPHGYPAGSCEPGEPPKGTLAQVYCNKNVDPDGPLWATYTLVSDNVALDAALNNLVESSTTVVCPGNIQSPGAWRRNTSPKTISGVLYCGIREGRATVAWTDDAKLLMSAVQTDPPGPGFAQLYAWWSSHS